jgi:hypothetical protein
MAFFRCTTPSHWLLLLVLLCCEFCLSLTQNATFSQASFRNTTSTAVRRTSDSSSDVSSTMFTSANSDVSTASTRGLADFVALGLGISTSSGSSGSISGDTVTATTLVTRESLWHASHGLETDLLSERLNDSTTPMTHMVESPTSVPTNATNIATNFHSSSNNTNATASQTGYIPDDPYIQPPIKPVVYNQSFTLTGDCWNRWSQFWSAESLVTRIGDYYFKVTTTYTTTESDLWMSTSTVLSFYTTTVRNGPFPVTTYSTLAPVTEFDWTGTPTTTWTTTQITSEYQRLSMMPNAILTGPSCVLPSIVPQCQSSWDRYLNFKTGNPDFTFDPAGPPGCNPSATTTIPISCKGPISSWNSVQSSYHEVLRNSPPCSQATIPDDYCSAQRSHFIFKKEATAALSDGVPVIHLTETIIDGTLTMAAYWPANSTISGPGCTLGCGSCGLQGRTVELLYWPPATTAANISIHGPVTVEALGTTFTSPTVSCPASDITRRCAD